MSINYTLNYNISSLSTQLFTTDFPPTEDSAIGFVQNFNGDFSQANPTDLQLVNNFFVGQISTKTNTLNSLSTKIIEKTNNINLKNTELSNLQSSISNKTSTFNSLLNNITQTESQLSTKNTLLSNLQSSISEHTNTFNSLTSTISNIESQLVIKNTELSNLNIEITNKLAQEGVSLSTIRQKLNQFNQATLDLNETLLQNPTVNLYASGSIKKLIPFKKKTKFFITLNGREQWKTPPKASNITIKGLVSCRLATGSNTPEYNSAGKWRDVTKYFKPKLSNLSGRWCIELDNRKINDFPTGYWDEFVIRYDDPQAWSGEIIHWSWGQSTVTVAGDGDLMSGVADLRTAVEGVIAVLEDVTGEVAPVNNTGNNSGVGGSVTVVGGTAVAGTTGSSTVNANIGNSGLMGESGLTGEG